MNNPDFVQIGETKDLKCVMSIPCEKFPLTRRKRKLWRKRLVTLLSRFSPMSSRSLYGSHSTRNHFTTGPLIPSDHFPSHPSLFFYGKLRSLGAYAVRGQTLGSVLAEEGWEKAGSPLPRQRPAIPTLSPFLCFLMSSFLLIETEVWRDCG